MTDLASVRVLVYGLVQGVFFRDFTLRKATGLKITGYVRNLPDEDAVEVQAEGERKKLQELISCLRIGPPAARVEKVETTWSVYSGNYSLFIIRH